MENAEYTTDEFWAMREGLAGSKPMDHCDFGKWASEQMVLSGIKTYKELAKMLHVSNALIGQLMCGASKPSFPLVAAFCYILDTAESPEEIYEKFGSHKIGVRAKFA